MTPDSTIEKFGLRDHKTENPPEVKLEGDRFLAYWAGFIDGDGSIGFQSGRSDCWLKIQCHRGWLDTLATAEFKLYEEIEIQPGKLTTKLDSRGYAHLSISNNKLLRALKRRLGMFGLPLMTRKWGRIEDSIG